MPRLLAPTLRAAGHPECSRPLSLTTVASRMPVSEKGHKPAALPRAFAHVALVGCVFSVHGCERHITHDDPPCTVESVPAELELDPFYQKNCDAEGGLPVVASSAVSDEALGAAAALVARVLGKRPALATASSPRAGA